MDEFCSNCLWVFVCLNEDFEKVEDTGFCDEYLSDVFDECLHILHFSL